MNDGTKSYIMGLLVGFLLGCVLVLPFLCTGCASPRGLQAEDSELVSANSRNVGRIESTVSVLDATVRSSNERLEIVARAGERIRDAGERLDYLFNEYEREVNRVLDEIDSLRKRLQEGEEGKVDGHSNTGD